MRTFLAVVAILSAVIAEGSSLQCEHCKEIGPHGCSGIIKTCSPTTRHCFQGMENNTVGGHTILTWFKGCLDPSQEKICSADMSALSSDFFLRITAKCCDTDSCNDGAIDGLTESLHSRVRMAQCLSFPSSSHGPGPPINTTLNGYKCKDCYTESSSDGCDSEDEIRCTGNMIECASFKGTAIRPDHEAKGTSMKGCISRDACATLRGILQGTTVQKCNYKCTVAKKVEDGPTQQ